MFIIVIVFKVYKNGGIVVTLLLSIVLDVILPVFILIAVGAFIHRKIGFNLSTLSSLLTYLLLPVVAFTNIYESHVSSSMLGSIMSFWVIQTLVLMGIVHVISKFAKFDKGVTATFKNSVVLNNSGNFGLPISQLVFYGNPVGLSIQIIVMTLQNLLTYTYGLMNCVSVNAVSFRETVITFLKIPVIYALILGFILNSLNVDIPSFLWNPIKSLDNAFLAVALVTLGAQSAYLKLTKFSLPLTLSVVGRLLISPALALLIIFILKLDGTVAQGLFIASSFPSSRNSAQFALEYGTHPEYAAQAVIMSTMLSSVTVTMVVYLAKVIF